ncbi:unnamed protein product, partial [Ectocarpus fasciculatus]
PPATAAAAVAAATSFAIARSPSVGSSSHTLSKCGNPCGRTSRPRTSPPPPRRLPEAAGDTARPVAVVAAAARGALAVGTGCRGRAPTAASARETWILMYSGLSWQ